MPSSGVSIDMSKGRRSSSGQANVNLATLLLRCGQWLSYILVGPASH